MRLRRLFPLALAVLGLCLGYLPAAAQPAIGYVNPAGTGVQLVDAAHPLPVTGGGGGGGGGGAVTAISGAFVDGWNVTLGAEADAACGTDNGTCTQMALLKRSIQRMTSLLAVFPTTLDTNSGAAGASTLRVAPATGSAVAATSTITSPTNTPTVSTSAYSTGFVLGGIQSFTGQPTTGVVANVDVTFNSGSFSAGTVDFYIFNASPTGGGTTDHAAFALTATDTGKLIGVLHLSDCTSLGGILAQCQQLYQSQFYTLAASGTTIFAVAVVRGAPTFTGTTDVSFSLQVVK